MCAIKITQVIHFLSIIFHEILFVVVHLHAHFALFIWCFVFLMNCCVENWVDFVAPTIAGEMALITRNVLHKLIFKWNIPSDLFIRSRSDSSCTLRFWTPTEHTYHLRVYACVYTYNGLDGLRFDVSVCVCVCVHKCESCYSIECEHVCVCVWVCNERLNLSAQRPAQRNSSV